MEDKALITEAYQLLSELNQSFQNCKQGTADDFRLQEHKVNCLQLQTVGSFTYSFFIDTL